jgi:hypothetical protein
MISRGAIEAQKKNYKEVFLRQARLQKISVRKAATVVNPHSRCLSQGFKDKPLVRMENK